MSCRCPRACQAQGHEFLAVFRRMMIGAAEPSYANRKPFSLLAAVRQKPGGKCNKSDDHQKNGRICEGVERSRQLLHWPDLPFVLNQSTLADLHCKEVEIPRFASGARRRLC